ncbi:MAG: carboxypeptidase regulatory-like domain-containing protein [Pyrinomonadaceae bacterium]
MNLVSSPAAKAVIGFSVLFLCLIFSQNVAAISSIEGGVFDTKGNSLSDVHVELLNEYGQSGNRARTDGTGRYRFDGIPDGRYSVRAMPFQLNFQDKTIPVEVRTQNIRGGEGRGNFQVDFYLVPKRLAFADSELGVIFVQEIPPAAKKQYLQAVKDFDAERLEEGITALSESIKLFENYFDAVHRMGMELYQMKRYKESLPFFFRAAEINKKSVTSLYFLGSSFHNMGKEYNKAAVTTLSHAYILAPASPQILVELGKAERAGGKIAEAEKHLLLAKKLAKGPVAEIHKELAQLYAGDLKKYKEAADELELYLKASKATGEDEKKTKKVISDLRAKAQPAPAKS